MGNGIWGSLLKQVVVGVELPQKIAMVELREIRLIWANTDKQYLKNVCRYVRKKNKNLRPYKCHSEGIFKKIDFFF